jgi:hypothetical protein
MQVDHKFRASPGKISKILPQKQNTNHFSVPKYTCLASTRSWVQCPELEEINYLAKHPETLFQSKSVLSSKRNQ